MAVGSERSSAERSTGVYRIFWDGRDDGGRDVPSGVCNARLVTGADRFHRKLTKVT